MSNGDVPAITELRREVGEHKRDIGILTSRVGDLKDDVNAIGRKAEDTRLDVKQTIGATEKRVNEHVDSRVQVLEDRLNRLINTFRWVIGLSVPAVCTLLGLLIGKTG